MERKTLNELLKWKEKKNRKPLLLTGDYVKIGLNQEKPYK